MEEIINALHPSVSVRRTFKKNTLLLRQGDVPSKVYIVISGCVKVYRTGQDGEEMVAGFKAVGDIFPEPWAFGFMPNTIYNYETADTCELAMIDRDDFKALLADNPTLQAESFSYSMKNYMGAALQVTALEQSYAIDKLVMILHYLTLRYGVEKKPGEYWMKVKLSHSILAHLTGLTRETVTTELGHLRRKGVIDYGAGRFMVRRQPLIEKLGDAGFFETLL